jgi:hypothetical protein
MHDGNHSNEVGTDSEDDTKRKRFAKTTPGIAFDNWIEKRIQFDSGKCITYQCEKPFAQIGLTDPQTILPSRQSRIRRQGEY